MDETSDPPVRPRSRTALLLSAVVATGLAGAGLAAATDRLDSALLFVGVPCLLALGIGLVRGKGGWGTVFQVVTVVLLLVSALLQEAAVCVLLAAPLVYGTAGLVYAATSHFTRGRALAVGPVLAVLALEGVLPGARIHPEQHASATNVVARQCSDFEAALDRGPDIDPDADRGNLLRVFPYPTPTRVTGGGFDVDDAWHLSLAGGQLTTRVTGRSDASVTFAVQDDGTRLGRWVTVAGGALAWEQARDGCRATLTVDYERRLDPALWFGPVTAVFMDAGASAFLAGLD